MFGLFVILIQKNKETDYYNDIPEHVCMDVYTCFCINFLHVSTFSFHRRTIFK